MLVNDPGDRLRVCLSCYANFLQGKKSGKLRLLWKAIVEDERPPRDVARDPELGYLYIQFHRGLEAAHRATVPVREKPVEQIPAIYVLLGPAGCGKTKWAWDTFGPTRREIWAWPLSSEQGGRSGVAKLWADGYEGQKAVLLDEFSGRRLSIQALLEICDRYPVSLPVKGSFCDW